MFCDREARIHWLNWKDMYTVAEEREEENFFELSAILADSIEGWCGSDNLLEWAGEELCEEVAFDPTVMVHVRSADWPWDKMMEDLRGFSENYPEMILMVTFIEGEAEGRTFLCAGRLTTALYNPEEGSLFLAF